MGACRECKESEIGLENAVRIEESGWRAIRASFSSCDVNGDQMKCFPRVSLLLFQRPVLVYLYLRDLSISADTDSLVDGGTSFQVKV